MELSVSAWCLQKKLFSGEMDILDFINFCNENGVKNVELLDCFLSDKLNDCIKLLDKLNMKVSSYSIGNDFVHNEEEKRKAELQSVFQGIDTAVKFKAKYLRVFSGNVKDDISYNQGREWILYSFKEAAKYAEKKGVIMVLENHGFFAGKSSQVKEIIEYVGSPNLRANTDVGNFLLVEENPLEAVKNLHEYVSFVHFKDFKFVGNEESVYQSISGKHYQGTVLGRGDVPLKEVVDYLYIKGYNGYLSIEYEGIGDPLVETSDCIKYANSIIK